MGRSGAGDVVCCLFPKRTKICKFVNCNYKACLRTQSFHCQNLSKSLLRQKQLYQANVTLKS